MSNSKLVCHTRLSPNCSARTQEISKITPHHMSGNLSVETCGNVFAPKARQASSNYGIDTAGRVGMYVPESKRAWTSSSAYNDQRAVTIEVANSSCKAPWPISDKAYATLVDLCVDICKRNPGIVRKDGKTRGLWYSGDKYGSLTKHKMFANTDCPGTWLDGHLKQLEGDVNARLDKELYGKGSTTAKKPEASKPATKKPSASKVKKDSWVLALQKECNKQGYSKQTADGIAGPNTLAGCPTLRKGSKGAITKLLQKRLIALGFPCGSSGADGSFGSDTYAAVRKYQKAKGFSVDGVVGKNTWKKLLGL